MRAQRQQLEKNTRVRFASTIPATPQEVEAWHACPGAFGRLTPPWEDVRLVRHDGISPGDEAVLRLGLPVGSMKWVARHAALPGGGAGFADVQEKGPFARWEHHHRMQPADEGATHLVDDIAYRLPLGGVGRALGGRMVARKLLRQFAYRHRVTRADIAAHTHLDLPPQRIGITGASGLIGRMLVRMLRTGGHKVVRIVRSRAAAEAEDAVFWNPREETSDPAALENFDAVVHLAGESVGSMRWTESKRMEIMGSRVNGTQKLAAALSRLSEPPKVFLSASAVGIYGDRGEEELTEDAAPSDEGFLAPLCQDWERAALVAEKAGIRTGLLRIGVVLSPEGGALARALSVFEIGLGGYVTGGPHYLPWVTRDDVCYAILHLLAREDLRGPFNLCVPEPTTQYTLCKTLGRVLGRPAWLPVPPWALRLAMGAVADEVLNVSQRAVPTRLRESGFRFQYPDLEEALRHVLGRTEEEYEQADLPGLETP